MLTTTIIVVAILTCLIFALAALAFISTLKTEKHLVAIGEKDTEIREDAARARTKKSKVLTALSFTFSSLVVVVLTALATTGVVYKTSGKQFSSNGHVGLVIASDSMNGFYSEEYQLELPEDAAKDHFAAGDIVNFDVVNAEEELIKYEVYGYQLQSGKIITHRLIGATPAGYYVFRGDNTAGRDNYVKRDQVILHYNGTKIEQLGLFVLFSQSGFGIYSLISVIGIYIMSDIFAAQFRKITKERLKQIGGTADEK